jgi:chemosensory pili system protein ChpA (sensor histidine kinase/response regulator)
MNTRRILVVDDELHMIRVIKLFLERAGYKVDTASNGQDALASILRDPPDVLLTDINMPRMTGQQLCAELHKQLPERTFPIFVMTSMTDREHREWTEKMPNTALLEKPVSMRVLIADLARRFPPAQEGQSNG